MKEPLIVNNSNSSPQNYKTISTKTKTRWDYVSESPFEDIPRDRVFESPFEDIPLGEYKKQKPVTGFKKSSSDRKKHTPDICKDSKQGENDRYNKIEKHVTEQYNKLKTFLETHSDDEYQDLADRIPWNVYITQMTNFYANKGLLHNNPSAKKSAIKSVTRLGRASQFDELIFCAFNLQQAVKGMGKVWGISGAWYLWAIFLIPTVLQVVPNALMIQPADQAKDIIDPDYTKFKVSLPKNLEHVRFLHYVLDILEKNEEKQLRQAKFYNYLLTALSGLVSASTTYYISNQYDLADQTKYILTASSGVLFPVLTHTGILGKGITFTNAVLTVGTFLITNFWGSIAQGLPIFALFTTFIPTTLSALIPTGTIVYTCFLAIGFIYYLLLAGIETWKSALTYFSEKNPMIMVFLINFFSGMEIFVQYAINSLRRGLSMSGIVTQIFNSFNPQCYPECPDDLLASPIQKLAETIAFIAGTDNTAKSRNAGANYFLKPFTFDLFGRKDFVLTNNKLLDFDKAKSRVSLTRNEILKMLGYSTAYALFLGAGTGLGAALFTKKLKSIVTSALAGTATAGVLKFYTLRTELIQTKARAHIDKLCGNEEPDAFEPRIKSFTFSTLIADNGMRVLSIAGMGAAISLFSDYDQSILYWTFFFGSLLPIISEWDFSKPKAIKGNQDLVDGARKAVGSHMYLMSVLPDGKELAKYKNTFVLIKQPDYKLSGTATVSIPPTPTIYFIDDELEHKLLIPVTDKQNNTVKYAAGRITDADEHKPICDRSGNTPKQVQKLYKVLNKIKSSQEDLESKMTEPAEDKDKDNDDEQPQGNCSRTCDCVILAIARLTVTIFGSVKPQSSSEAAEEEAEAEEKPSSTCIIS